VKFMSIFYELYITMEPITQHTTRDLHQTPVEECGPSSRHEYVPFEQSHLNVVVPMIVEGVQDDHLNNAFMKRVWVKSRHDINMEHDEDKDTDIERFIINGGVWDDDDDDNALQ
jgi:hypothetical protein